MQIQKTNPCSGRGRRKMRAIMLLSAALLSLIPGLTAAQQARPSQNILPNGTSRH
jgi:hypothetical protein